MAATLAGRRLTEAHRLAQARLGAQTVARMRTIWRLMDPDDVDGSFDRWLAAALPLIQAQRSTSSQLAVNYLTLMKQMEFGPQARLDPVIAFPAAFRAVSTSLLVTGPLSVKRAMSRGVPIGRAWDTAEAASSASAMRFALEGGRETITGTTRADPQARGFVRVASGNACNFCEDLAGIEFADDAVFQAHDGCSCTAEPVYR